MDHTILAAVIGAGGGIIAAITAGVIPLLHRVEDKIDGLRNGTYHEAMAAIAEIQRERAERELRGLPTRRLIDRLAPDDHRPSTEG
jgi:hypothetical protein